MYIAPEYETGRVDEVTEKGDIFSIGKVIWCMLNGEPDDFMPSNFWFIDEYDLTKRYPSNPDMIKANTIIASCLNIDPKERSSYPMLIAQIQGFIENYKMNATEEMKLKVTQYQEKRRIELLEIKEKNRLLVNCFSRHYIDALQNKSSVLLNNLHHSFHKNIEVFGFINLAFVLLFCICGRFDIFHLATSAKESGCTP